MAMALSSARIGLFISTALLGLNLAVSRTIAQTLVQTDTEPDVPPSYIDRGVQIPSYTGAPPPPSGEPLPSERLRQDTQPLPADFRVSALQPDFTGDLWVGSWTGLA